MIGFQARKNRRYFIIREFGGWRLAGADDEDKPVSWLEENAAQEVGSEEELYELTIKRLK